MAICKTLENNAVNTRDESKIGPKMTHVCMRGDVPTVGNDREEIGGSASKNSTGDGVEGQGV